MTTDDDMRFSGYVEFASYLSRQGWIVEGGEESMRCACAAFESYQRSAGIESARSAMLRACDKAR